MEAYNGIDEIIEMIYKNSKGTNKECLSKVGIKLFSMEN